MLYFVSGRRSEPARGNNQPSQSSDSTRSHCSLLSSIIGAALRPLEAKLIGYPREDEHIHIKVHYKYVRHSACETRLLSWATERACRVSHAAISKKVKKSTALRTIN